MACILITNYGLLLVFVLFRTYFIHLHIAENLHNTQIIIMFVRLCSVKLLCTQLSKN